MNNNQSRIDWNQKVKTVLSDTTSTLELKKKIPAFLMSQAQSTLKLIDFMKQKY
jgi:hypothetical protein